MDNEAISAASAPLPDESLQSAPAGSASQTVTPPTNQADTPAPAATPSDSAPETGEQPPPDALPQDNGQPPKKKPGVHQRIDELTRERHEAKREADYWRQMAQQQAQARAEPPQPAKPAPKITDFQDFDQYQEARDSWVLEQAEARIAQRNAEMAQHQQQAVRQNEAQIAQMQVVERFKAQEFEAATRYPDYTQTVQSPLMQELKQVRPDVAQAVIDSPHGADVVYFLGKNPAQIRAIASLPPLAAAREIGRIEQMFMQPRSQSTNAPPPPRTVGGNAQVERKPEDMSMQEYRAFRNRNRK